MGLHAHQRGTTEAQAIARASVRIMWQGGTRNTTSSALTLRPAIETVLQRTTFAVYHLLLDEPLKLQRLRNTTSPCGLAARPEVE